MEDKHNYLASAANNH